MKNNKYFKLFGRVNKKKIKKVQSSSLSLNSEQGIKTESALSGGIGRRRGFLEIFVIPAEVAFISVANVTGPHDPVIFVGIDDQLGIDAQTS